MIKIIVGLIKAALCIALMAIAYVLIGQDEPFCKSAGFSPRYYGAEHYFTIKQFMEVQQGYYEYSMKPELFCIMRNDLAATYQWDISTYPVFFVPQFGGDDGEDCCCFLTESKENCRIWMAYDEKRQILYAGYYNH